VTSEGLIREEQKEPRVQPRPSRLEHEVNQGLERAASVLTSFVATLLIVFVVVALIGVVVAAVKPIIERHDFLDAAVNGIVGAFLAIILLELAHTTLTRGPVTRQVQEFLVVGITASVRAGLEVAAEARTRESRDVVTSLAINSIGVLLLVCALWLIRRQFKVEQQLVKDESASA
jgi:phosphate starvation-inducible membrane PsiE